MIKSNAQIWVERAENTIKNCVEVVVKTKYVNINSDDPYKCCYCEITLTPNNYTREHVIPKHRGGRIIKPCCKKCNFEKGGLMLHSYIQLLNSKLLDYKGELLIELQTKIKNANRLAKEIEKNGSNN